MLKVIVFDFDGVIVDSEPIKQEGYIYIFNESGKAVPHTIVEEVKKEYAGRGNRTDIIRGILTRLNAEDIEGQTKQYVARYGEVVEGKVRALEVTSATRTMLENLSAKYPLYINSATPEDVLGETVKTLQLEKYFKHSFGSPQNKIRNLEAIARLENIQPQEILFVGDGEGDYAAAKEFGCTFVGIATELNGWKGADKEFPVITSVAHLEGAVTDIAAA